MYDLNIFPLWQDLHEYDALPCSHPAPFVLHWPDQDSLVPIVLHSPYVRLAQFGTVLSMATS